MKLKTLLGWSLAAGLLAACSGGAGSVTPSNGSTATGGNPGTVAFSINTGKLQSAGRSAKFIGTNVDQISYSFTPGPINGSLAIPAGCTTNVGPPVSYTCNVTLAPGVYNVTITLKHAGTSIGTASAVGFTVTSGATVAVPLSVDPIQATETPALSVCGPCGTGAKFRIDGQAQDVDVYANELDAVGNIITTFYGPVGNWQTLTWSDSGGANNITLPASIAAVPALQTGSTTNVHFTGVGPNATSLTVTLSDGTNTSSMVIPYISLTNNSNNPAPGQITLATTGVAGQQTVTVTETSTDPNATTNFNFDDNGVSPILNSTTNCGANATITASSATSTVPGANQLSASGANATVTYTVKANTTAIGSCNLVVAGGFDANLTNTIQINFPGTAGLGVTGHSRQ